MQGDDDPIDICELGETPKEIGSIFQARVLGSFCLIDQGEVDWKVLVMDEKEANEKNVSNGIFR